jgi:ABC-type Mn2+/Zn2+ transport system permease subunit
MLIALGAVWTGLFVSWYVPYPVSFFIVSIVFGAYLLVRGVSALQERSTVRASRAAAV